MVIRFVCIETPSWCFLLCYFSVCLCFGFELDETHIYNRHGYNIIYICGVYIRITIECIVFNNKLKGLPLLLKDGFDFVVQLKCMSVASMVVFITK